MARASSVVVSRRLSRSLYLLLPHGQKQGLGRGLEAGQIDGLCKFQPQSCSQRPWPARGGYSSSTRAPIASHHRNGIGQGDLVGGMVLRHLAAALAGSGPGLLWPQLGQHQRIAGGGGGIEVSR